MREDENYYPEPEDQSQVTEADDSPADEGQENALLPRSIFPKDELKVGDTCTFKVTQIYEDEVEVVYDKSDKSDETDEPAEKSMDMMIDERAV